MHDNLTRDTNKKIEATPENLLYIFGTDPVIGKVRFDTRRGEVVDTRLSADPTAMAFTRPQHEFLYGLTDLRDYLASAYQINNLSESLVAASYDEYLKHFAFDPVREYLRALEWDGFSRLGVALPECHRFTRRIQARKTGFCGCREEGLLPWRSCRLRPCVLL